LPSGKELSYRQLDNLAKYLERYKLNKVDYQTALAINHEAVANGLPPVYTHKRWIWSGLENTRHKGMDGEVVELEEPFTVVNEVSGVVDYLMFPGDVESYANVGNVINCGCFVEYITDSRGYDDKINSEPVKSEQELTVKGHTDEYNVHDYNNGELKIYESKDLSSVYSRVDEVKAHYDSLPLKMRNSVNEIIITNRGAMNNPGWVSKTEMDRGMKRLYVAPNRCDANILGKRYQDTINHEIGHLMDYNRVSRSWSISNSREYQIAFDKDKALIQQRSNNREFLYSDEKTFSSGYGYRSNLNPELSHRPYSESLADDVRYYLAKDARRYQNMNGTAENFLWRFPNRAKYIQSILY